MTVAGTWFAKKFLLRVCQMQQKIDVMIKERKDEIIFHIL